MADYFDNDTLITTGEGRVLLNLKCGYGQPVTTTVYLKKIGGETIEIASFAGDAKQMELGNVSDLQFNRVVIFSVVHDIRDVNPGQEVEDIHLEIELNAGGVSADTTFIKKTKGAGTLVNCTYEVIIL